MPAEPQLSTTTGVKSFCMVVSKLLTGLLIDPPIDPLTGLHTGQLPTGRGGTVTAGLELMGSTRSQTNDGSSVNFVAQK